MVRSFLCMLLLLLTTSSGAQPLGHVDKPFSTSSTGWEGYSEFIRLAQTELGKERVRITSRIHYGELSAHDSIVIIHPENSLDENSLSAFLSDGGRVAVLDDFGSGKSFLRKFGIVSQPAPTFPSASLRNNSALAIAIPSVQVVAGLERGQHPSTEGVDRVVVNHATTFKHPDLTTVLEIPDQKGRGHALSVTGVIAQKGRLFALGDPSVFINLMMRYPGNRRFAQGLLRYLAEERTLENGQQEGQLIIVANDFDQLGSYGEPEGIVDEFKDRLNRAASLIADLGKEGLTPALATSLAAALFVWIFFTQLRSTLQTPRLLTPSFTRPPSLVAQLGLAARASLLSSKSTHPVLALMELDSTLREAIARRLKTDRGMTPDQLALQLEQHGLSAEDAAATKALLIELRTRGQSLNVGRPSKTTDSDLKRLHISAMRLLGIIQKKGIVA